MKRITRILILLIALINTVESYSQFTYLGGRLSYYNVQMGDPAGVYSGTDASRINSAILNLDLVHRPIRNLGFGISTRIPIYEAYRYDFTFNDGTESVSSGGTADIAETRLAEGEFSHDITLNSSIAIFTRIFFNTENNFFVDLRYVNESFTETYTYRRGANSNNLPAKNSNVINKQALSGFGIGIGTMPMIGDHFYGKYQFNMDFIGGAPSMNLDNISSTYGPVVIPSRLNDNTLIFELSFGLGYAF